MTDEPSSVSQPSTQERETAFEKLEPDAKLKLVADEGYRMGYDSGHNLQTHVKGMDTATETQRLITVMHIFSADARTLIDAIAWEPPLMNAYTSMWLRGLYDAIRGSSSNMTLEEWDRAARSVLEFKAPAVGPAQPIMAIPKAKKGKWDISEVE